MYNEKNTYKDVEREIALARSVFVLGLPTAISFGIVSVGKGYGSMFELIDAKTISELIAKTPEHTDYYAGIMAGLAVQIHSTRPDSVKLFPEASAYIDSWIKRADLGEDTEKKLFDILAARPVSECLVHGDFHTGNVFLSNNEPLFIDVDRMAVGDPIVDLSSMYLFYVGYAELDPKIIEDFMGISVKTAAAFYQSFIRQYLKTDDETELEKTVRSASLWAFVRLIGQIKKKPLSEKDREAVKILTEKVRALID